MSILTSNNGLSYEISSKINTLSGTATKQRLVVVLGMHRSGTSLLSNILSNAGFYIGEPHDLIDAGKWNRKGYFERLNVLHLNDHILSCCDGSWLNPPSEHKISQINMDDKIKPLLSYYDGHPLSLIKDPRICLTFPVWQRELSDDIKIIRMTRQPRAVIASLIKRFRISRQHCHNLLQIYNERACQYAKTYPNYTIAYEDLLSPKRPFILNELSSFLEIKTDLEGISKPIVDPSLNHHNPSGNSLQTAIKHDPISHEKYNICLNLIRENKIDKAIVHLEDIVNTDPCYASAHNDLGVLYYKKGKTEDAIRKIRQAVKLVPEEPLFNQNLNKILTSSNLDTRSIKNEGSSQQNHAGTQKWWNYSRFVGNKCKILIVSVKHLLLREIQTSLLKLGHESKILFLKDQTADKNVVEALFESSIRNFKPDFVITVNHLGFDQEGVVTDLLTHFKLPFASWYVDSPHLIIHHYEKNKSPYLTLFLWDKDYIKIVKNFGFDNAEYLPLGVDETLFCPIKKKEGPLPYFPSPISFVGNSMANKIQSVLNRNNIHGKLLDQFNEVSDAFENSSHLIVREMMKNYFPDLFRSLINVPAQQAYGYEAAVTWQATGWYRARLVKSLQRFSPLIVGDTGWNGILGNKNGFHFHKEINYYSDLPYFYNTNRLQFNSTSRQMKNGVNQRIFDVPACRSVVITDRTRQLENLMEPGKEILAYTHKDEVPDLVDKAIRDQFFFNQIASSGYHRAINEHTYTHRLEKLIRIMKNTYQ